MKKLFVAIFLIPSMNFAQTEHFGELIFTLVNHGSSWNVTFKIAAIGARWDKNFDLTEDHGIVTNNIQSPLHYVAYFDHIFDPWAGVHPIYAFGLYKISAIENGIEQAYFYMDWRTSDITRFGDVHFKYDVTNNRFRDKNDSQTIDKTYQSIWNLLGQYGSTLETSGFEDYWDNGLALIPSVNNNPYLIWGPHPDDNVYLYITGYNIYRAINSGSYSKIVEVNETTFSYIDTYFMLGGSVEARYKVTANYQDVMESTQETTPTNTVTANVGLYKEISGSKIKYGFEIFQNYPNPFNPTTTISWTSPKDEFVSLKVFDVLGREVAALVNEYQNAGEHSIEFNANILSSGVYIYRIQIGEYIQARNLILQK